MPRTESARSVAEREKAYRRSETGITARPATARTAGHRRRRCRCTAEPHPTSGHWTAPRGGLRAAGRSPGGTAPGPSAWERSRGCGGSPGSLAALLALQVLHAFLAPQLGADARSRGLEAQLAHGVEVRE